MRLRLGGRLRIRGCRVPVVLGREFVVGRERGSFAGIPDRRGRWRFEIQVSLGERVLDGAFGRERGSFDPAVIGPKLF